MFVIPELGSGSIKEIETDYPLCVIHISFSFSNTYVLLFLLKCCCDVVEGCANQSLSYFVLEMYEQQFRALR